MTLDICRGNKSENRAHKSTKLNVRSDRTKLTNNDDAVVSISTNTSINVEACDIEPTQDDNKQHFRRLTLFINYYR